ncbi:acyltransferase family protein [Vibrio breoganii]
MIKEMNGSAVNKIENVQILRGVAVLLVLVYHLKAVNDKYFSSISLPNFFEMGSGGVDLFFVISGFIIIYITRNGISGNKGAIHFLLKRAVRVYPVYWVYSLSVLIVYLVQPSLVNSSQGGEVDLIRSFLLIPHDTLPLLMVGWSLSYEIYFYILIFLAMLLFSWDKYKYYFAIISLLVWGRVILSGGEGDVSESFFLSLFIIEFVLGAFLGFLYVEHANGKISVTIVVLIIYLISAIVLIYNLYPYASNFKRVIYYGIPSFILLFYALFFKSIVPTLIGIVLRYIGNWSYSIYLSHILVINVVGLLSKYLLPTDILYNYVTLFSMFVFSILLGMVSYELLERRMCNFIQIKIMN